MLVSVARALLIRRIYQRSGGRGSRSQIVVPRLKPINNYWSLKKAPRDRFLIFNFICSYFFAPGVSVCVCFGGRVSVLSFSSLPPEVQAPVSRARGSSIEASASRPVPPKRSSRFISSLYHLAPRLAGSHSRLLEDWHLFQLSLITLQVGKSFQARE